MFDLEDGVPTDAYSLEEAIKDEWLVPYKAISVPLKFQREGIKYNELSEEEKVQWDLLEWDEDEIPDSVNAAAVNDWLFNIDTVDKVLAHVMTNGIKVEGGDRLGKTIIFAKNQKHAEFIEERFNINYPHLAGKFARIITFKSSYAQSLLDDFSIKDKDPHIAISVDMLDTGVDVPEVVNLVLFKLIRSKTKFWQIIGRGTRLCENLFGPEGDKEEFYVFDFCQNLEFFSQNPKLSEGSTGKTLSERLFTARLDLVLAIDEKQKLNIEPSEEAKTPELTITENTVRTDALEHLIGYVGAMNLDNFIVRPKRRAVERFQNKDNWTSLDDDKRQELISEIAPLPAEVEAENEEAKRFDLLMFNLQLALLKGSKTFDKLKKKLQEIAESLEEQIAIPVIAAQGPLIQDIQGEPWWDGINVALLELVRLRLRNLIQHIDKVGKTKVYSNFEDEIGEAQETELGFQETFDFVKFKKKARHFLQEHNDVLAMQKLRRGKPLTASDLQQLEDLLVQSGAGDKKQIKAAANDAELGLGQFVRNLVGLEKGAVDEHFRDFVANLGTNRDQIEFVEMIKEELLENNELKPARLYESPFIDVAPSGPEDVFDIQRSDKLFQIVEGLYRSVAV